MSGSNYSNLRVWQKAVTLVERVYRITAGFPKDELYGLTSQMRRAAVSTPSNIAEGQGRRSRREFRRFLSMAHGSLRELETQLVIAERLGILQPTVVPSLMTATAEIGRLLNALRNSLARKDN